MHLLLTDRLACPRCGPSFGLVLLSEEMHDRRVVRGSLGCPNCRDTFPIVDSFADLRTPPRGGQVSGRAGAPRPVEEEEAYRLAALMGVAEGPGTLLLVGAPAAAAEGVARVVPGVEVVAADGAMAVWPPAPRVTRVVSRPGLPFFDGTFRGVVVDGGMGGAWIGEAARVAARAGRVVVVDPPAGAEVVLEAARMSVLARDAGTIVAARG